MGQIYKSAHQTLVWLGEKTTELEQSFQSVQDMRDRFLSITGVANAYALDHSSLTDDDWAIMRNESVYWEWKPLVSLLQLPWFRRKWVTLVIE